MSRANTTAFQTPPCRIHFELMGNVRYLVAILFDILSRIFPHTADILDIKCVHRNNLVRISPRKTLKMDSTHQSNCPQENLHPLKMHPHQGPEPSSAKQSPTSSRIPPSPPYL